MVGGRVRSLARGVDKGNDRITWCLYGKAPMRQLHGKPIAVSGSGYTRKQINSFEAVIHTQESPPQKRFLVGCGSPLMRLAQHLTFCFALDTNNICCLVGDNPTCSVPALSGCEGLWSYDTAMHDTSTPPSPRALDVFRGRLAGIGHVVDDPYFVI